MVIGHQQMVTPPLPQVHSTTVPSQYHYSFPTVTKMLPHKATESLSVMSAPAPVVTRQELMTSASAVAKKPVGLLTQQQSAVGMAPTVVKSQRPRAPPSNNLRLKQMEIVDNHAVVFS